MRRRWPRCKGALPSGGQVGGAPKVRRPAARQVAAVPAALGLVPPRAWHCLPGWQCVGPQCGGAWAGHFAKFGYLAQRPCCAKYKFSEILGTECPHARPGPRAFSGLRMFQAPWSGPPGPQCEGSMVPKPGGLVARVGPIRGPLSRALPIDASGLLRRAAACARGLSAWPGWHLAAAGQ